MPPRVVIRGTPRVTITLAGAGSSFTRAQADALYEPLGAVADHEAAADPHPGYLTEAAAGTTYQPLDSDLTAIAGLSSGGSGYLACAGVGSWGVVAKIPQSDVTLSGDLAALEALSGTGGWAKRTAANTWTISTPTAADVGAQALDAGLTSLLAVDTAADIVPYTTGAGAWAGATLTSFGRSLLDDADAAAARVTLGIEHYTLVVLSGDVSESAGTDTAVAGLQFTPEVDGIYHVEVFGLYTAAATTTGLQWRIDCGNGSGGGWFLARGASFQAQAVVAVTLGTVTPVLGTSSGGGETPFWGWAIVTAAAAAPTAVQVYFSSEIAASAVTLKGSKVVLRYRRIA